MENPEPQIKKKSATKWIVLSCGVMLLIPILFAAVCGGLFVFGLDIAKQQYEDLARMPVITGRIIAEEPLQLQLSEADAALVVVDVEYRTCSDSSATRGGCWDTVRLVLLAPGAKLETKAGVFPLRVQHPERDSFAGDDIYFTALRESGDKSFTVEPELEPELKAYFEFDGERRVLRSKWGDELSLPLNSSIGLTEHYYPTDAVITVKASLENGEIHLLTLDEWRESQTDEATPPER